MAGAVGSTPSFACSGWPVFSDRSSFALSSSSRIISAAPFFRYASCSSTALNFVSIISPDQLSRPESLGVGALAPTSNPPYPCALAPEEKLYSFFPLNPPNRAVTRAKPRGVILRLPEEVAEGTQHKRSKRVMCERPSSPNHPPSHNSVFAFQHDAHSLGINPVLLRQNPRRQRLLRVLIANRHRGLQHNRSGIQILIHEVHRASGKFHAIFQRLPRRFQPLKQWQQRRMNIKNTIGERSNEKWRNHPHFTR